MANEYTFGQKLQGIGAALSGTVPQFQQEMQQLDEARIKAMYQDAGAAYQMLQGNNYQGIIDLANDRLSILRRLPGSDPSDTQQVLQLAQNAMAGDTNAKAQLYDVLGNAYSTGVSRGLTQPLPVSKYLGTEDGVVLMQAPSGQIERIDLYEQEGAGGNGQSYAQRQAWKELRKDFKSGSDAVSNNAKTVLEEYGKVEGLINQATDKNVDDRSRRQAAATLVTVLARMASPGVVTDRDFINFSGGLGLLDYAKSEAARGGDFALFKDYLSGKGLDDTIVASIDPMNPDGFSREGMLALANNLVIPAGRTLLGTFASQMSSAKEYNPAEFEMRATFSPNNPNIKKLGEIAFEGFNMRDYYSNPESYIIGMQQQSQQATPQPQQPQQMMPPPGTTLYPNYEAAADAARSMAIGDVIYYWDGDQIRSEELQ